jgi:hypothetical protein
MDNDNRFGVLAYGIMPNAGTLNEPEVVIA